MPKTGERHQARWVRDKLLIAWALHHPERIAEFFRATWKPDNTGHIRRHLDGFWTYRNPAVSPQGAASNEYRLAQLVADVLPVYVEHARPLLLKPGDDTLLGMPSNHIQVRLGNMLKTHLGRAVTYSELRELELT
jgi:hypothetical protein